VGGCHSSCEMRITRAAVLQPLSLNSTGLTRTLTLTRTSSPTSEVGVSGARVSQRASRHGSQASRHSSRPAAASAARSACQQSPWTFVRHALFLARMSVGDSHVYTCTCTVHDKLSCTHLQNYTIGASLKSVSVPCNLSFNRLLR